MMYYREDVFYFSILPICNICSHGWCDRIVIILMRNWSKFPHFDLVRRGTRSERKIHDKSLRRVIGVRVSHKIKPSTTKHYLYIYRVYQIGSGV